MNKWIIRTVALLMVGALLLGLVAMVFAEENENVLTISSVEEFLTFAENCRLDSYSQNLVVHLQADIDLSGTGFAGIPIFCGEFYGNNHTISGLDLTNNGSYQGLFRYLTETAVVNGLTLTGTVLPGGSKNYVGILAGSNEGRIENCRAEDVKVSGADKIGGLVGYNGVTGVITACFVSGTVQGTHFVGGIAGENMGKIETCRNEAQINTSKEQNRVDMSDITMDTILGVETTLTVTDLGGIAGTSSGTILNCVNVGNVGYPYIGYNVGGIAGSQKGYLAGCSNLGDINGRKEVGGIVGQLEPYTTISFATDTLQILKDQVADLSVMTKSAVANAKENLNEIDGLVTLLEGYTAAIEDATAQLDALTSDPQIENLEELKTTLETVDSLVTVISDSLFGISSTTSALYDAIKDTASTLDADLGLISGQVEVLENTLNHASDNLGGTVTDSSDEDTQDHTDSKVDNCQNFGHVLGDLNVGGIAGAIAVESDLDPEQDVQILGENTLNYDVALRSVIRGCNNSGKVQARKQRIGGIVGWMSMGLTVQCINTGAVDGAQCVYAGGIAGSSAGYIRECGAKCSISGKSFAGGIAGEGVVVSDCRGMTVITGAEEKVGAILGAAEDRKEVTGNYYVALDADPGAIDGISYAGCALGLDWEVFRSLEKLPKEFLTVTLTFLFDDGTKQTLEVEAGGTILLEDVPQVPLTEGKHSAWKDLTEESLTDIRFDQVFVLAHTLMAQTIKSQEMVSGRPVLLALGQFYADAVLRLDMIRVDGATEGWAVQMPQDGTVTALRYLLNSQWEGKAITIMVRRGETGAWEAVEHTVSGRYAVIQADETVTGICAVVQAPDYTMEIVAATAVAVLLLVSVVLSIVRNKKKTKGDPALEAVEE